MSKNNLRNIIDGRWLIDPQVAAKMLPAALDMLKNPLKYEGEHVIVTKLIPVTPSAAFMESTGSMINQSTKQFVAVVEYEGVIQKYGGWCSAGTEDLANEIDALAADSKVAGIVLNIESPGGAANAVERPSKSIREAKKIKPVLAYAGNGMVASAAYWIASQCDEIYTEYQTDQVGSIGAYLTMVDYKAAMESYYEAKVAVIYATKSTEKNKGYRDLFDPELGADSEKWILANDLDPLNESFHSAVKSGRPQVSEDVFKGGLFNSDKALELGLIDGLKTLQEVIDRAVELSTNPEYESNNAQMTKLEKGVSTIEALKEQPTADNIATANAFLVDNGITGAQLVSKDELATSQENADKVGTLTSQVDTMKKDAEKLTTSLATQLGLTVDGGVIKNAEGKETTIESAVAELVAENKKLSGKPAVGALHNGDDSDVDTNEVHPDLVAFEKSLDEKLY